MKPTAKTPTKKECREMLQYLYNVQPAMKQTEIAQYLNDNGFKTPVGTKWRQENVSAFAIKLNVGRRIKRKQSKGVGKKYKVVKGKKRTTTAKTETTIGNEIKVDLIDAVLLSNMKPEKKIELVRNVLEL